MKRTCRDGIIDFDAMNVFAPDGDKPFCQVAAAGYGPSCSVSGTFVQTDDMGLVLHRDLAFKMLADLCIRTGADSMRYLYSEYNRSRARDGFREGLALPEAGTGLSDLAGRFGIQKVMLPDIACIVPANFAIFDGHDMMSELRGRSQGSKAVSDIMYVMDSMMYVPCGSGSFMSALDALNGLMGTMPADELRSFSNMLYGALDAIRPHAFSMLSVRPGSVPVSQAYTFVPDAVPDEPETDPGLDAETDTGSCTVSLEAAVADAGTEYDNVVPEDGMNPDVSGDDGDDGACHEALPDPELETDPDGESHDCSCHEPLPELETDAGDGGDGDEDPSETEPGQDGEDGDIFGGEPDPDNIMTPADGGGGEDEPESETDEPETEPESETEPPIPMSAVVPVNVSDIIGKDESYASGYLADQYERELAETPSEGLLDATVAARANGTASPLDVMSETIHKVSADKGMGRGLREKLSDMARDAREAAPGAELGTGGEQG